MNELDDRALAIALDDAADARHDIDRIRRGFDLVAGHDAAAAVTGTRRWLGPVAVAAVLAVAGIAGITLARGDDTPRAAAPATTDTLGTPGMEARPGPALTLDERVAQADRVVVGAITDVERGELEPDGASMPYALATIDISETIKGKDTGEVVAFDYDFGGAITSSKGAAAPWNVGDRVLLFLVSDAGTVSEGLEPAQLQVADGAGGRYAVVDGELVAPFTLDDVRDGAGT